MTLVRPELVAEISADRAVDHGGIFRHPVRFKRLRLDVMVEDVPRFGDGTAAEGGPGAALSVSVPRALVFDDPG